MGVRRALKFTGVSQTVTFVLSFASVVIVSRLLKPEEIGIYSVAVSVLGLAHIFREFGVGQYLVQAQSVSRERFRAAFSVALITSWLIALALFLLRTPMSALYGHQGIGEVLLLLAINFLVLPLGTPVMAMMIREMQFDRLAFLQIFGAVVQTSVTIVAAWLGESYLSMAWGSIAMTLSKVVVVQIMRPGETFILPTTQGLREVLKFGGVSSSAAVVHQLGSAAPDLILGRTLGFAEVALFSRGVGLYRMVVERVYALVRGVHFPNFASDLRKGGDGAALYCRATNYLVGVVAPVLAVLAVLSHPLILFVFGEQWSRSVWVSIVVCTASILTAPYSLCGLSLTAAGKVGVNLKREVVAQGVKVLLLLSSIWLPLELVVLLLSLAYLCEAVVSQWALGRVFGLGPVALFKAIWRGLALVPFAAAAPALAVGLAHHWGVLNDQRLLVLLTGSVGAALGWGLGLLVLSHPLKSELARVLRWLRPGARAT
jgi:O-antigen/teichoic acid export membrane protein